MSQYQKTSVLGVASSMTDIRNKKIFMGFWHNWPEGEWSGSGYKGGYSRNLSLLEIPEQYNVVAVAFMKVQHDSNDHIPTFKPYFGTDEEFRLQVKKLNDQGRAVLISLGGADAHISLSLSDESALVDRIIYLVETYGFDGLDIDLEQTAIKANDNQKVIPSALKKVKDHYRREGKNFIISMAPEFPYLRVDDAYTPYITSLEGYYDFIAPQFYNQGADGVWAAEGGGNLAQNNDAVKENFLYYLTESIITGTRGYLKIPHDKFVIGLPSNKDAANNGYVIDSNAVINALARLESANLPIKGLMTWSINWDGGREKNGSSYNWEFTKRYGFISNGQTPTPEPQNPSAPTDLRSTTQTNSSVTLEWTASSGSNPIRAYTIYRDSVYVGTATAPPFVDVGLKGKSTYRYQVSAVDTQENTSLLSAGINVTTLSESTGREDEWQSNVWYADNTIITSQEYTYVCAMQHTSTPFWHPAKATSLWAKK